MDKPTKRKKLEHDFAVTAFRVVQKATGQIEPESKQAEPELIDGKNPHAVALGRLGGGSDRGLTKGYRYVRVNKQ